MGCAGSKSTVAVEAPTLLASGPKVNLDEKVATTTRWNKTGLPTDGKSTDAVVLEDVIGDKVVANANEVAAAGEPAPEPKTICEATESVNDIVDTADTTVDKPDKVVTVTQTEAEEARGISVDSDGDCCGIHGGAHVGRHGCGLHLGRHGCGLHLCGLGGNIHLRDTVDENESVEKDDAEARGISIDSDGCCGIGGGAHVGCHRHQHHHHHHHHGCGLHLCGLGGDIHFRNAIDESVTA